MTERSTGETSVGTANESGTVGNGFSTESPTPSPSVMSTTSFNNPPAAGEPTTGSDKPAAAGPASTSSTMSMAPIAIVSPPTATNSFPASLSVRPTNSPTADSTSNAASEPSTVESRSKGSAGIIAGGIIGALLALAAIFAAFFFVVRRNRRKKAAEGVMFDRSYFIKSGVKLDDDSVNTITSPSPLPTVMIDRHVDSVRSHSVSSYVYIDQGHSIDPYHPPAANALPEQQYLSDSSSPGEGTASHHPRSVSAHENPFMLPTEDPLATGPTGFEYCGTPVPDSPIIPLSTHSDSPWPSGPGHGSGP